MTQTIVRVPAVQAAKIFAIIYFLLGIVFLPFFVLPFLLSDASQQPLGFGFMVALPVLYGAGGFIGTLLMCWLYNAVARRVGGIQLEFSEAS